MLQDPVNTSGLAVVGAKRVTRTVTAFQRVCIDSYVKSWLMLHERVTRLPAAGKTHVPTRNCRGQPTWLCQTNGIWAVRRLGRQC